MAKKLDFSIETLGRCTVDSPLDVTHFVDDSERILHDVTLDYYRKNCRKKGDPPSFEVAGPRKKIFFDPSKIKAGIVTCGGLCPGINDVIRGLVNIMWYSYGVRNILGFRYGYQGLAPEYRREPMELTPDVVRDIHKEGGSILASSRGPQEVPVMVDALERMNVNVLFAIGGDGTQRGALEIHREARKRKLNISVIGIPKTIDNDMYFIEKSFGFETAFGEAVEAIRGAHTEAEGAPNGVGVVKLMGRHSGFIAATATLAMSDVNFCLVPEVPFQLEGKTGLFSLLEERLKQRHHAVIVVAEGAGQDLLENRSAREKKTDASGNLKLEDIGIFLVEEIKKYLKQIDMESNVKYIDPSYIIRSVPSNPTDSVYCMQLAQNAVHAAMAGKSGMVVGEWNNTFTHVPIGMVVMKRNNIDPNGALWLNVLESTGQPSKIG